MALITAPLNRLPRGLLDLFGIKSMGVNLRTMGDVLSPTFDLTQWFTETDVTETTLVATNPSIAAAQAGGTIQTFASAAPVALPVSGGVITVPDDELWLVTRWVHEWIFSNVAAQVADATPAIAFRNNSPVVLATSLFGFTASAAAVIRYGARNTIKPEFLMPGTQPIWTHSGVEVGGNSVAFLSRVRLVRMRV